MNFTFGKKIEKKQPLKENLVRDYVPEGSEGFKIDYSRLKKAVMQCELNNRNDDCKRVLKEMGIEVFDD